MFREIQAYSKVMEPSGCEEVRSSVIGRGKVTGKCQRVNDGSGPRPSQGLSGVSCARDRRRYGGAEDALDSSCNIVPLVFSRWLSRTYVVTNLLNCKLTFRSE